MRLPLGSSECDAFSANFTHVGCRLGFNSLSDHVQSACLAVRELLPLKLTLALLLLSADNPSTSGMSQSTDLGPDHK